MRVPSTLLIAVALLCPVAHGGGWTDDWGSRFSGNLHLPRVSLKANVTSIGWTDKKGRTLTRPLPRPTPLSELVLVAPPGEWVELTLTFDGPVTLTWEDPAGRIREAKLDLGALCAVLEEPSAPGQLLVLDLALPEGTWRDPESLRVALEDGARVVGR